MFWLVFACSEQKINSLSDANTEGYPDIELSPTVLDFGVHTQGDTPVERQFTITNVGENTLHIQDISIDGVAFSLVNFTGGWSLDVGESTNLVVEFTASTTRETGVVHVFSTDPDEADSVVYLQGMGTYPELSIQPNPLVFPYCSVGCTEEMQIQLQNTGLSTLTVYNISSATSPFIDTSNFVYPFSLEPNDIVEGRWEFHPMDSTVYASSVQVLSNDPRGMQSFQLQGMGMVEHREETWTVPTAPPSDIIFSVDLSSSMSEEALLLGTQFQTFITQLSNYTQDWQVMVVNADHGCNHSGILTLNTPNYASIFATAAQTGAYDISFTEALLTAVTNGVEKTDAGECNAGFLRSNAMLHIIMLSDECEQSPNPGICGTQWQNYVDRIIAQKGDPSLVKISAVAGDYPSGCGTPQTAEFGSGYWESVQATGGVFLSICSDWTTPYALSLLASASVSTTNYVLSQEPIADSIVVSIDGQVYTDWTFDLGSNSVGLTEAPPSQSVVEISYDIFADCAQ